MDSTKVIQTDTNSLQTGHNEPSEQKKESWDIEDFFYPDTDCSELSEISTKQRKFINHDATDFKAEDYYVGVPDEKFYLHVAAYRDIREAGFQRQYLITNGHQNCKILELKKDGKPLYAVTIGDFGAGQILDLCNLKQEWDDECSNNRMKSIFQPNFK